MTTIERVLVTTDTAGGVFTYAVTLATELSARGIGVDLATMGPPLHAAQRAAAAAVPGLMLHESTFALEWDDDPWADVDAAGAWLRQIADRTEPDLVHLNGYAHGDLELGVPKVVGAHSCVLSWWEAVLGEPPPARYDEYRLRVARGLRGADVIVACSHAFAAALEQHYGPLPCLRVVHNGALPPRESTVEKEPFVFSCGRAWDRAKNVAALGRVASSLRWPIKVAGWEVDEARHASLESLGWLGPDDVGAWMERASIFALPARYEPFGLSALEAAQRGAALVLGDLPSQHEIWGDAALYVDPDDDGALRRALERLIASPRLRAEQAAKAKRRASAFTARAMTDAILAAYEAACA